MTPPFNVTLFTQTSFGEQVFTIEKNISASLSRNYQNVNFFKFKYVRLLKIYILIYDLCSVIIYIDKCNFFSYWFGIMFLIFGLASHGEFHVLSMFEIINTKVNYVGYVLNII